MSLAIGPLVRPGFPARLGAAVEALLAPQHGRFAPWLAVALGIGVLAYFDRLEEPGWQPLWLVPPLAAGSWLLARRWLLPD